MQKCRKQEKKTHNKITPLQRDMSVLERNYERNYLASVLSVFLASEMVY